MSTLYLVLLELFMCCLPRSKDRSEDLVPLPPLSQRIWAIVRFPKKGEPAQTRSSVDSSLALMDSSPGGLRSLQKVLSGELNTDTDVSNGYWYKAGKLVMTYPYLFLIIILGLLAGMMYVFISEVHFGSDGVNLLPLDSPIRQTYDDISAYIPSLGSSTLEVYMSSSVPVTSLAFLTALDSYSTSIESIEHVLSVRNLVRMESGTTVAQYFTAYSDPASSLSRSVLQPFYISDLQYISRTTIVLDLNKDDDPVPSIIRQVRGLTNNEVVSLSLTEHGVTGSPAQDYDVQQELAATFPYVIAVIVCGMFILLFVLTGSFFLPIKAIITASLSLISSFGFIVLIFQRGPANAESLLQFKADGTLDPLEILFIFAVSFGLSLDYEGYYFILNLNF